MFERYPEQSRRAIFYSLHHALGRGSDEIETGDLVLGIASASPDTSAAEMLDTGHPLADLKSRRPQLREMLFEGEPSIESPEQRQIPLSKSSKRALAYAAEEAQRDNRHAISLEHLLRGVLRTEDRTKPILAQLGYTLGSVRLASKKSYRTNPDRPAPIDPVRQLRQDKRFVAILVVLLAYMILQALE